MPPIGGAPSCFKQHQVFHEFYRQKPKLGFRDPVRWFDMSDCTFSTLMMKIWIGPQLFQASSLLASFQVTLVFFPSSRFDQQKRSQSFQLKKKTYFSPKKTSKNHGFSPFFPKKHFLHFVPCLKAGLFPCALHRGLELRRRPAGRRGRRGHGGAGGGLDGAADSAGLQSARRRKLEDLEGWPSVNSG